MSKSDPYELPPAGMAMTESAEIFKQRVLRDLLPRFCHDLNRQFDPAGFSQSSIKVSEFDAEYFLRALDAGLVVDAGGGRYRAQRSEANEQIFWEGAKAVVPRPLTLWLEPVITIGATARLHFDLGWPADALGMQSKGYAFDLIAYDGDRPIIAGEVKKTSREVDALVAHLTEFGGSGTVNSLPPGDKRINAFRKWLALVEGKVPYFWAIGPDDYTKAFGMDYHVDGTAQFHALPAGRLTRTSCLATRHKSARPSVSEP